jgi:hypothetical protein
VTVVRVTVLTVAPVDRLEGILVLMLLRVIVVWAVNVGVQAGQIPRAVKLMLPA